MYPRSSRAVGTSMTCAFAAAVVLGDLEQRAWSTCSSSVSARGQLGIEGLVASVAAAEAARATRCRQAAAAPVPEGRRWMRRGVRSGQLIRVRRGLPLDGRGSATALSAPLSGRLDAENRPKCGLET